MQPERMHLVYVVGFPKSGNTWLCRLLADAMMVPVVALGKAPEIATDVNAQLQIPLEGPLGIAKVHHDPDRFLAQVNAMPKKVVYIYRDYRDVAVSAFFYWDRVKRADVEIRRLSAWSTYDPRSWLRYFASRLKLLSYVRRLGAGGTPFEKRTTGTWSHHVVSWQTACASCPGLRIAFVSYERLHREPARVLCEAVEELGLPAVSPERAEVAVARQSMESLRRRFTNVSAHEPPPLGDEFNLRFLRRGEPGDWRNFLSVRMCRDVQGSDGQVLLNLGYESHDDWWREIRQ